MANLWAFACAFWVVGLLNLSAAVQPRDLSVPTSANKARTKHRVSHARRTTGQKRSVLMDDEAREDDSDDEDIDERRAPRRRRISDYDRQGEKRRFDQDDNGRSNDQRVNASPNTGQQPLAQKSSDDSVVVVRAGTEGKKGNDFTKVIQGVIAIEALKSIMSGSGDSGDVATVAGAAETTDGG